MHGNVRETGLLSMPGRFGFPVLRYGSGGLQPPWGGGLLVLSGLTNHFIVNSLAVIPYVGNLRDILVLRHKLIYRQIIQFRYRRLKDVQFGGTLKGR